METLPNPRQPRLVKKAKSWSADSADDVGAVFFSGLIGGFVSGLLGMFPDAIFGGVDPSGPGLWEYGAAAIGTGCFWLSVAVATVIKKIGEKCWPPLEFRNVIVKAAYLELERMPSADREEAMPAYRALERCEGVRAQRLAQDVWARTVQALRDRRQRELLDSGSVFLDDAEQALTRIKQVNRELGA